MFINKFNFLLDDGNVAKIQISFTFKFAITDYKIQSVIFKKTILNFRKKSKSTKKNHRRFCLIYLQLFRFRFLHEIRLLKSIKLNNIDNKFYTKFEKFAKTLDKLSKKTLTL